MSKSTTQRSKKTSNSTGVNDAKIAVTRLRQMIENLPVDEAQCRVTFQFQSGKPCRVKTGHRTKMPPRPANGWKEVTLDEIEERVRTVIRFAIVTEQYGSATVEFVYQNKKLFALEHDVEESFTS